MKAPMFFFENNLQKYVGLVPPYKSWEEKTAHHVPGCPKSEARDLVSGTLQIWKTGMLWRFDVKYARNVRMAVCINIYYMYI